MMSPGGNLVRKYRAEPRARPVSRDVPLKQLRREIDAGFEHFCENHGGMSLPETNVFNFGKRKTA